MQRFVFFLIMGVVFALQFWLCLKGKRVIWKLLPLLALSALVAFCVISYALSGWNNWAFLILVLFASMPLGAVGAGWLLYGIYKLIKKF